jgi:hypothetical protein
MQAIRPWRNKVEFFIAMWWRRFMIQVLIFLILVLFPGRVSKEPEPNSGSAPPGDNSFI